jgi:hypothetical protein
MQRQRREVRTVPEERFSKLGEAEVFGSGTWVTIWDKKTTNEAKAWGRNKEEAEEAAWDKLERIQGPVPAKRP